MTTSSGFYTILIILYLSDSNDTFNVDTLSPLVITDKFDGPKSQFGTTVSLVANGRNGNGGGSSKKSSWVIIGAPKGSAHKIKTLREPGTVWRCSLGKITSDSCDMLEMDHLGNEMQFHHAPGGEVYHLKDSGFLGSSLSLGNDRLLACAPRWSNQRANNISQSSHYLMNGLCYWRPKVHLEQDFLPELLPNHTLIPLRNKDRQGFRGRQGFDWSLGQAGFSAHVTDDAETILGAPGVYDWRGTVIRLRDSGEPRLRRNGLPEDFGTFFQAPQLVMLPELETSWKANATYFGYAVTSGRFMDTPDSIQYVASAPRGGFQHSLTGHVLVFTFPETDSEPLRILSKIEGPTDVAAYFGYALCAVDVNNDGFTDLLVGAPLHTVTISAKLIEAPDDDSVPFTGDFVGHGDEGAVFIYISDRDKLTPKGYVTGNNEPWARFGSAIAALGDINHDGYNDVAIGTPYEDSKRGAIYIYHGGGGGLVRKPAQVIHAKELDTNLRGFGFSISPGVDLDGNGYPDLAVGAYLSSQVVILRTKPVIRLVGNLTSTVKKIPINKKEFTFELRSCVGFESKDANYFQVVLNVKILSDVNSIITRVFLTDGSSGPPKAQIDYGVATNNGNVLCRNYTGIVKQRLTLSGQRVMIRQEVAVTMNEPPVQKSEYTILPIQFGATVPRTQQNGTSYNSFCKHCPVTESNVTQYNLQLDPSVLCGDDETCLADLQVTATFTGFSDGDSFVIGSASSLHLHVELTNLGETSVYPKLVIAWLRLGLVTTPSDCGLEVVGASYLLTCSLGQVMETGHVKRVELDFDMAELMAGEQRDLKQFVVTIEPTTTSDLVQPGKIYSVSLPMEAKATLDILATVSRMNVTTLNPYNVFTHSYLIKLEGPTPIKTTELQFDIPESILGTSNNNGVVNITQIEVKQDNIDIICNGPDRLSALFHSHDPDLDALEGVNLPESKPRRKRAAASTSGGLVTKNVLTLNCNTGQIDCVQVVCLVHSFIPGTRVTVDITFRMSQTKAFELLEAYGVQTIEYKTRGRFTMLNVDITVPPREAMTRMHLPVVATANIILWVGGSIAAGLLVIICISFLLYCCGVFDRKKIPEEEVEPEPELLPLQTLPGPNGDKLEDTES